MAKYFSDKEIEGLDPRLVILMDQWRDRAGIPIVITCGYRSPEHNEIVGGVENSAHTKGLAADVRCSDSATRFKLIEAAFFVGFKRIEAATKHVHVDIDETKPQNVLWLGISK